MLCIACAMPMNPGDLYYSDVNGGFVHTECCGPELESYTDENEEPLKPGDPIPEPSIWEDD